jgi:UDP-N-acetylglucosamine 2-epimerase (non-hydrolysing)
MLQRVNDFAERNDHRVVFSVHPRTSKKIRNKDKLSRFIFSEPFGFLDYLNLQNSAYCVVSDSGSLPEEALTLRFPAVIYRNSMERPEALESGHIVMSPAHAENLESFITRAREAVHEKSALVYPDLGFSSIVLSVLESTARLAAEWAGAKRGL